MSEFDLPSTAGSARVNGLGPRATLALRLQLLGWSLVFLLGSLAALGLVLVWSISVFLIPIGIGLPLTMLATVLVRWFADRHRDWASRWGSQQVDRPYRLPPRGNALRKLWSVLRDPATWRDWAWLLVDAALGWFTAGISFLIFAIGLFYTVYPLVFVLTPPQVFRTPFGPRFHLHSVAESCVMVPLGLLLVVLWYVSAVPSARLNAVVIRSLLAPTTQARLRARVSQLATSRAETVDTQASELRRIERDLHDGAQARLASLGMSLGLAEQLLARNPQAAARLLSEARESTSTALGELRDLVRGIHPPVLADRGLDGAIQALALANPVPTTVNISIPGRLPAPVESAAYFAVAEALANAIKHAKAHHIAIGLDYRSDRGGMLVITVHDDGQGGAQSENGTGLRGIQRRLAAFDGTLAVSSPVGGPTEVRMSLPCALS